MTKTLAVKPAGPYCTEDLRYGQKVPARRPKMTLFNLAMRDGMVHDGYGRVENEFFLDAQADQRSRCAIFSTLSQTKHG